MRTIADAPFFVDSRITAGIQIADMAAGVIRIYEENRLHLGAPKGDAFLSAVKRYYSVLEYKSKDLESHEGYRRVGFYRMPERDHYRLAPIAESPEQTNESSEGVQKPENQL